LFSEQSRTEAFVTPIGRIYVKFSNVLDAESTPWFAS
jgi:hypothetical protein